MSEIIENKESIPQEEDSVLEAIIVGLRNGLERGETMEKAKETLIGAGYDSKKVEEASRTIELMNTNEKENEFNKKKLKKGKEKSFKKLPKNVVLKKSRKKLWIYIVITIIVLVLSALLGLYWEEIISFF